MACDLHTHSTCSDGTRTPAQLIEEACRLGLSAIALTDHNCVSGISEFSAAAKDKPLLAIPGVELSTDCHGTQMHLLGLFLSEKAMEAVTEFTREYHIRKTESNRLACEKLAEAGYPVSYDAIVRDNPGAVINRAHIAQSLVDTGSFSSVAEATGTLLQPGQGIYVPPAYPSIFAALELLQSVKAVPVLAHPFLKPEQQRAAEQYLPELKAAGLRGMEVCYVTYTEAQTEAAKALAARYHLLPSGGSDFHGDKKPGIALGIGNGHLRVPDEYAENLKRLAEAQRA